MPRSWEISGTINPFSPTSPWTLWPATRPTSPRAPGPSAVTPNVALPGTAKAFSSRTWRGPRFTPCATGAGSVWLAEAVCLFHDRGLEPKRLRLVQQRPGKEPYLFLLECRKGGGAGLVVEETLVLTDGSGNYSLEMERIYGDYLESNRKEPSNA